MVTQEVWKKLQRVLTLLRHVGIKYVCPFCGYPASDLAPWGLDVPILKQKQVVGAGLRRAACYRCGSSDRERLVFAYLDSRLAIRSDAGSMRVLHIAPEPLLSERLRQAQFCEYVCGDLFADGYIYPSHVQNMNVLAMPFSDDHFDLIICNHVLEHVPDDRAAMRSIYRVLKPGGRAILQVPISLNSRTTFENPSITDPREREQLFGQFDHVRIYGQDYGQRLEDCGFKVVVENISASCPRLGVDPRESIFVACK